MEKIRRQSHSGAHRHGQIASQGCASSLQGILGSILLAQAQARTPLPAQKPVVCPQAVSRDPKKELGLFEVCFFFPCFTGKQPENTIEK